MSASTEFNDAGLRINTDYALFQQSGEKCYFCWLGWSKYGDGAHLHPQNLGWVECDAQPNSREKV